jgi:hypothetical protein
MPDVGMNQAEMDRRNYSKIRRDSSSRIQHSSVQHCTLQHYHVTCDQSCLTVRSEDSVDDYPHS